MKTSNTLKVAAAIILCLTLNLESRKIGTSLCSALLILFFIFGTLNCFAVTDTLRHYDKATSQQGTSVSAALYPSQFACFQPPAPGFIKSIIVTLGGTASSGSVTLHLYGHEGGSFYPQLQQDLITPVTVKKTISGIQRIQIDLQTPVWIDNNLFFIKINNFSSGVTLVKDNVNHPPFCFSNTGGYYSLMVGVVPTGEVYRPSSNAFAIDVVIDYTEGLTSPRYLQDVTAAAGIDTNLSNNCISWGDIDKDGFLDLLISEKLYKNNGNGTFTDITTKAGINVPSPCNTTFLDMNNDGKEDILLLHPDKQYNAIYVNNGDETFTKKPLNIAVPDFLVQSSLTNTLSIADFNNDKYPDLFVGQAWKNDSKGNEIWLPNYLYVNNQNLGFIDTTALLYKGYPTNFDSLPTRASQWVDYNDDNQMDLYVANYRLMYDELWENDGKGGFTDVIDFNSKYIDFDTKGGSGHGTGVDWADYDNDGDMDLLLPSLAHPVYMKKYDHRPTTLYQNTGTPDFNFNDLKGKTGIQYEETHAGTNWGDLNNDGLLDFAICAFYGCRYTDIYLQNSAHNFELKSFAFGINNVSAPPDLVLADYNNDGKLDLACGDKQVDNVAKFRLFKNIGPFYDNYVDIDLSSTSGNAQGVGAKVKVYAGGNVYTQYQMPYHGSLMSKGNRIHFGLGKATNIDSVVVRWPNGTLKTEKYTGLAINNFNVLTEGGKVVIGIRESSAFSSSVNVFPNPASESMTFNYELAQAASVTLVLYSMLGQKISVLNEQKQSGGKHAVQWETKDVRGNKLAAGIYSYRIQAGEQIKTGLIAIE